MKSWYKMNRSEVRVRKGKRTWEYVKKQWMFLGFLKWKEDKGIIIDE